VRVVRTHWEKVNRMGQGQNPTQQPERVEEKALTKKRAD
jgi:hypothetical protein